MNVWEHQRLWLLHNGPFRNFFSASPTLPFINDCELSFPFIAISLIQLFIPVDKLLAGCDTRLILVLARRDVCSSQCILRYFLHAWPCCSLFHILFSIEYLHGTYTVWVCAVCLCLILILKKYDKKKKQEDNGIRSILSIAEIKH